MPAKAAPKSKPGTPGKKPGTAGKKGDGLPAVDSATPRKRVLKERPRTPTPPMRVRPVPPGVAMSSLMSFVFPSSQEHPNTTARLELFGRYGPTDKDGRLHGGVQGNHLISDDEIRGMCEWNTREAFFHVIKKPRSLAEVIVDTLLPMAMSQRYTKAEVTRMLRDVQRDVNGEMSFQSLQGVIFERQQKRLQALFRDGPPSQEHTPRVPYQSKPGHLLTSVVQKKKLNEQEEYCHREKRLLGYSAAVGMLDDQQKAHQIVANVKLCCDRGHVRDRWDRYSCLRNTGRASYVATRNDLAVLADDGLRNSHSVGVAVLA
eukprot:TRINITY_DN28370_c0_g1_i1.p1 TRINITY_DN28370_c0_g1~~TRINITY_DN28370_c0_g1_i1.p1  ORF type:complete len:327 (+),score=44.18 TRINITY_DN28370_c0_g1_i1:33-983(+)